MLRKSSLFLAITCIMATVFSPLAYGDDKSVPSALSQEQVKQKIAELDARIQELQSKKVACDSRAQDAGKEADRLHFQDRTTSRMYQARQEHFQTMSLAAQKRIEVLQKQKEELQRLAK